MWSQLALAAMVATSSVAIRPVIRDFTESANASQFRLAFNGPGGMTVSWNSRDHESNPVVYYGLDPHNLNYTSQPGVSSKYQTAVTYDNHVELTGLKPFTKYYYRVSGQSSDIDPEQEEFYFVTAKEVGDDTPFTVAAFGDLGIVTGNALQKGIPATFGALYNTRDQYDFMWHAGDFAYADDWIDEELEGVYPVGYGISDGVKTYENILASFYEHMTPMTKNAPYMAGPGNHEANCLEPPVKDKYNLTLCPDAQRNFTGYQHHFSMPTKGQSSDKFYKNMWYSWDYGMVHFVQINTETDHGEGRVAPDEKKSGLDSGPFGYPNQQLEWLEEDLASVDRSKTPWVVVAGHRPSYSSENSSICRTCREAFEDILYKHEVDLVWAGHVHYYERDWPVYKNQTDPNKLNNPRAPWYITSGAAGNFEGHSIPDDTYPDYVAFINNDQFGFSKLIFHNSTHLEQQFVSSETGQIVDKAVLYKEH